MASFLLILGGMIIAAGLIRWWLGAYHQRKMAEIETAELELDGMVKIELGAITWCWQCHECGTPLLTREAVKAHTGGRSSCRVVTGELDAAEADAEQAEREARWSAEQASAPVRPDSWPALGAEEPPGELESAS